MDLASRLVTLSHGKTRRKFGVRLGKGKVVTVLPYAEFKRMHDAHIQSKKWAKIREKIFRKRGKMCQACGAVSRIEVHHKHYQNLGRERLRDLVILCRSCHLKIHGRSE